MSSYAFAHAPGLPKAYRRPYRQSLTCQQRTIILVPDHFSPKTPLWYINLQSQLPDTRVNLLQMPNPYESNTKRWESVWLQVLRESTLDATGKVSLLGHGTGADACMRFLENNYVDSGVVLLAPTSDEYFAAERHGRPYHWDIIRTNVGAGLVLVTSVALNRNENRNLVESLRPTLVHDLSHEMGRYTEEETGAEIATFVRCANAMEIS